ncbi:MAG: hypothetical protein FJY82_10235 [Candidatus Aminicenantes bacterium]|nr:hypothetical protein [Candidatus Aminicenantes bacterium]
METPFSAGEKIIAVRGRRFLLKVETSSESADYRKYDDLREAVWGFPEDHLAGTRNLMCENYLHEGGSLFLAAYVEDAGGGFVEDAGHLVGFAYGFIGVKDKSVAFKSADNLRFYSQYTGVLPAWRGFDLGGALKELQAEVLSGDWGVFEVVCTFDPLTGVNARRNIHRFGMRVLEYRAATYGEYGGRLNRKDIPSDRLFMSWDLRPPAPRPALDLEAVRGGGRETVKVEVLSAATRSGRVDLEVVREVDLSGRPPFRIVRVPADFYRLLRETDVDDPAIRRIPLEWRMAVRRVFQDSLAEGYEAVDFVDLPGVSPARWAYILGGIEVGPKPQGGS